MTLSLALAVAVASGLGAQARYALDQLVQRRLGGATLPWGTMTVNVVGSAALGAMVPVAQVGRLDETVEVVLAVGLCGAFTTFSTWTYESVRLLEDGAVWEAAVNVGLSLVLGLAAALLAYGAVHAVI
ncbi:MAG TPA: fluoride efflux transporter CrcB [Jiangellales bacterium]|nr:fluoride efflux transporter CrcB [Jiangellales bacterium]